MKSDSMKPDPMKPTAVNPVDEANKAAATAAESANKKASPPVKP